MSDIRTSPKELLGVPASPPPMPRASVVASTPLTVPGLLGGRGEGTGSYVSTDAISVETLSEDTEAAWDDYVRNHEAATPYHLRAWRCVALRTYGIHAPYLIARAGRSGRICGALPLFVVRNFLGGYATTGLFGAYASALADTPETGRALLQCAQGLAEADGLRYLLVKAVGDEPGATGFSRHDTCVVATLPIDAGAEQLWRGFRGSIRQAVRKAQKVGFTVHAGPSELEPFYDVLAENMHHKGTPIYGIQFLRTLLQELGPSGDIVTLRLGGRTVAGAFTIEHRGVVCVPFASSRPEVLAHCPNNLLYWELIQRACGRGLRCLDFGRSPRGAGSLTFKLRWGATVTPAPFFVRTANGKAPALDPLTPGVQFLAHLWQRLPRKLADVWGPSVCGRFLA